MNPDFSARMNCDIPYLQFWVLCVHSWFWCSDKETSDAGGIWWMWNRVTCQAQNASWWMSLMQSIQLDWYNIESILRWRFDINRLVQGKIYRKKTLNKGTPPWGGCGFLQLCTWWLNQKSPFFTVIYSILWLWSMMFCRLLQEVKMPKTTFAIPQHLLEVQCILFFLSALSVGILRFEELAQSLDVLMLVCKSKLPWSHIDSKVGQRVFGSVILQSKGTLSSPIITPPTPPPPLQVKVARRQQQSWAMCLR